MTVAVRARRCRGLSDAGGATLATVLPALGVALVAAGIRHDLHGAWPFLLAGLLAPGGSQILFTLAVREVGAVADVGRPSARRRSSPSRSRCSFLGEPLGLPLRRSGRSRRRGRRAARGRARPAGAPPGDRARLRAPPAIALRDPRQPRPRSPRRTRPRRAPRRRRCSPARSSADALDAPSAVAAARCACSPRRPVLRPLLRLPLRGVLPRPRDVVSPLVATESLWGVALSALLFRGTERVGRRLAIGALLVVAGGVLIGRLYR